MQFIDQASAYLKKPVSLEQAVQSGRAKLTLVPGAEKLALCFRPELEIAKAFDARINARLKFNDLTTPAKIDLLIKDLLPDFFHAEMLPLTGRDSWSVRLVVDGDVYRSLIMDAEGIRINENGQDWNPAINLEIDIMTLLAMLRSTIAEFHLNEVETDPTAITALSAVEAASISGGMPAPDPSQASVPR